MSLIKHGHTCALVTRDHQSGSTSALSETRIYQQDLESESNVLKAFLECKNDVASIDGLVFCHRFRGADDAFFAHMRIQVESVWRITEAFSELNLPAEKSVVVLSSPAGQKVVADQPFAYHASKAALEAFIRWGAVEYGSKGLRINAIVPTDPVYKERARHFFANEPEWLVRYKRSSPRDAILSVNEIVSVIAFLLAEGSTKITGQVIQLGGGNSLIDGAGLFQRGFKNTTEEV